MRLMWWWRHANTNNINPFKMFWYFHVSILIWWWRCTGKLYEMNCIVFFPESFIGRLSWQWRHADREIFIHCLNISVEYLFGRFIWWRRCGDTSNTYLECCTIVKIYSGLNSRLVPRLTMDLTKICYFMLTLGSYIMVPRWS